MQDRQRAILDFIDRKWRSLPDEDRPCGVWIREYPALPPDADQVDFAVLPEAAWFLDESGRRQRSVWSWMRFQVVHCEQHWCGRGSSPEIVTLFGRRHQIGMVAFAPYVGGDSFYLEVVWGSLFGRGWHMAFDADGQARRLRDLWRS